MEKKKETKAQGILDALQGKANSGPPNAAYKSRRAKKLAFRAKMEQGKEGKEGKDMEEEDMEDDDGDGDEIGEDEEEEDNRIELSIR
jgi:hypothetical protein